MNFRATLWPAVALGAMVCAHALDTTITYTGGRKSGTFTMDGRANMDSSARTDAPDTVNLGSGLRITRVVSKYGNCILSCSYAVPTWLAFHSMNGLSGIRSGADSNISWDSALTFPAQLRAMDSIPGFLSPCGSTGPNGVGFAVSSDDATSMLGPGCGDVSTFRKFPGHDRILYHRKDGISLKLQVAGFEVDTMQCASLVMPYNCTYGDKIVFRYVLTDDSTGHFGSGPMSLGPAARARSPRQKLPEAWKSRLYRLILGRTFGSETRP